MRSDAKASSAGSTSGRAGTAGRTGAVFALAAFLLLALAPLSQAKVVVGSFGPTGTQGGQFGAIGRIAINSSGAGGVPAGTVYVTDAGNNRVQRLTPTGGFERAWGFDVDSSNPSTGFEVCIVASNCQKGSSAATTANGGQLSAPEGIDVNQTTGHVYVIDNGGRRVEEFDADGGFERAWGSDVLTSGVTTFEICEVASECKTAATGGTDGGRFGNNPRSLQIDPSGNVWIADTANRRFEKFSSTGGFLGVYGDNVNNAGAGTLQVCTSTATGVCKAGTAGSTQGAPTGQFGVFSPQFFSFDSAGNLYANNGVGTVTRRIDKFDPGITSATNFATFPAQGESISNTDAILALPSGRLLIPMIGFDDGRRLVEFDSAGNRVESFLGGVGLGAINGLTRNSSNGKIYVTTNYSSQVSILVLEDGSSPPPPVMTVNSVTTKGTTTASLSGTIDPQGSTITSCSFQYSTDKASWTDVPVTGCSSLAPGGGAQAVSASATGLVPNTQYFVRLAVKRLFIAGTAVSTSEQSFTTDPAPPLVSGLGALQIADTSARLVGIVDPRHPATDYVFKYGTSPGTLDHETAPVSAGSGSVAVLVSQVIEGLDPSTTYHYKLVATNPLGSAETAVSQFTTRADPPPSPGGRSYEQVSPVDKNGGGALSSQYSNATVAYDGEALGFCTTSLFGDPAGPQASYCGSYVSRRSADGWHYKASTPLFCKLDLERGTFGGIQSITLSLNLGSATIGQPENASCAIPPLSPQAPLPAMNLYREDLLSDSPSYQLLAARPSFSGALGEATARVATGSIASSDDFTHIVYRSTGNQTNPPDWPTPGNFDKVYEWDEGTLRLVSKDPAGVPLTTESLVPDDGRNGVSASGERIFFQNPTSGTAQELYLRESHTTTYDVSKSECSPACANEVGADVFRYATPEGEKALFTSAAQLVNTDTSSSGVDLYRFTVGANPASEPHNLALLSKDEEPSDGTNADVIDVLGSSDDGDTVFFVANGQIVAGKSTATGPKVYRWRWNGGSPTVDYLATLASSGDSQNWTPSPTFAGEPDVLNMMVTPSGGQLLIFSKVALEPVADTDTDTDAYRWEQGSGWTCVSCQAPGVASKGNVFASIDTTIGPFTMGTSSRQRRILISDDGKRVFFLSRDSLVPGDENVNVADVYEWHDGTLSLISSGRGKDPAKLLGASHDGRDVFFSTEVPLVGWDTDSADDIYDARLGGGFPEPPPTGAICEAEACRGSSSSGPAPTGAGSAAFEGPGNQVTNTTKPCRRPLVKRRGSCVKPKKGKHAKKHHHKRRQRHATPKGR